MVQALGKYVIIGYLDSQGIKHIHRPRDIRDGLDSVKSVFPNKTATSPKAIVELDLKGLEALGRTCGRSCLPEDPVGS